MRDFFCRLLLIAVLSMTAASIHAQIGQHRNDFAVGFNAGFVLSNVGFTPTVSQSFHGGVTAGVTARYVCEKYYSSICAIVAEVNFASIGWKEKILDKYDQPVINPSTNEQEQYSRTTNYVQIPIFARLGW